MGSSFAPLALPDGSLNPAAMLQASALLNALQNNDRAGAQALLAQSGDARIIAWTWFPETLPPDLCVILDGSTMYVVVIGTMNATQWTGQIAGATAMPYPPQPTVSVGAFWWPISQQLNLTLAELATPEITGLVVIGHSYGAALGELTALNFAQNPGQLTSVSALLLGGPNPLTAGYTGPLPAPYFRVGIAGDVVPQLPPAGLDVSVPHQFLVDQMTGHGPAWAYYGTGYTLSPAGGLVTDPATQPTLSGALAAIAAGNLTVHQIQNYTSAAIATYQLTAGDPGTSRWLPGAAAQAGLPSPQTPAPPIPQGSWVDVAGANSVYFAPGSSLITAENLGTIQSVALRVTAELQRSSANIQHVFPGASMPNFSRLAKCTFVLNNDLYGRFMSSTISNVDSIQAAFLRAQVVAAQIAAALGNSLTTYAAPLPPLPYPQSRGTPTVDFIRVSDALNPRVSQLFPLGGANYAGYLSGKSADFQATSLSMRLPGSSTQNVGSPPVATTFNTFGNFLFVGQPDDAVKAGVYVPGLVLVTGVTLDIALRNLLNLLTNSVDAWGFMGVDFTQKLFPTGPWSIFNVNFWQFTVTAHGWAEGDRIKITAANSIGFNGVYKIHVIDANTVSLTNGPRTGLPAPTQANARRVQLADGTRLRVFYRYQTPPAGWASPFGIKISKKNPGRRFTGVSFTKRKRRPR